MRFLVVGAGALGGYFGGRLLEAGQNVTFLLRPKRAAQLARDGLILRSPAGDFHLAAPRAVAAGALSGGYDVVLVACKAYDLDSAMDSIAPAVAPGTLILPLLNGMGHLDRLAARFGREKVLGGACFISAALAPGGVVLHLSDVHTLVFGELEGGLSPRVQALAKAMQGVRFQAVASPHILQDMWEKSALIASIAGITCLMRASIGVIAAAGAADLAVELLEECAAIASRQGFPLGQDSLSRHRAVLTAADSLMTASMFKDIERGGPTEAEHILGDLLRRGDFEGKKSLLKVAYSHVRAYEINRAKGPMGC
jgi:2-dehydropantoate 2-reductase